MALHMCLKVDFGVFILTDLSDKCNLENSGKSAVKEYALATNAVVLSGQHWRNGFIEFCRLLIFCYWEISLKFDILLSMQLCYSVEVLIVCIWFCLVVWFSSFCCLQGLFCELRLLIQGVSLTVLCLGKACKIRLMQHEDIIPRADICVWCF